MAPAASIGISNLSLALAAKSKPDSGDSAQDVGIVPSNDSGRAGLLTPPNSISPIIPPQLSDKHDFQSHNSVDSDVDLQDAVEHAKQQDQPHRSGTLAHNPLTDLDRQEMEGAITPAVVAEHHLPGILLGNGPVPIRYITSCLIQSLPGFGSIPPAKARRIIVSALEGRYHGGTEREVVYDKVGWGRWEARIKGQPVLDVRLQGPGHGNVSPPASVDSSTIANNPIWFEKKDAADRNPWFGDTVMTPPAEDMDMAEHEAEKMSLDGDRDSDSEAEPASEDEEATEEEDWATIGAEALRSGHYARPGFAKTNHHRYNYKHDHHMKSNKSSSRHDKGHHHISRSVPSHQSRPYERPPLHGHPRHHKSSKIVYIDSSNIDQQNAQERAAAEALLRMVSM